MDIALEKINWVEVWASGVRVEQEKEGGAEGGAGRGNRKWTWRRRDSYVKCV